MVVLCVPQSVIFMVVLCVPAERNFVVKKLRIKNPDESKILNS